jgi:hypothetical protein
VSKSVRRQVRLTTGEQQIPWESTSLELDFYFVPPAPPPSPAAHLLAAADETGNAALAKLHPPGHSESPAAASRLREKIVLDGAGPTYQGRELVRHIQEQLIRLDCMSGEGSGAFDAVTIEGLRRPSNSKSTASQIFSLRSAFRFRGVVWSLSELS